MAHSAQFFTLDEINPCCRPAPDNADGRAAPGYLRSSVPTSSVALPRIWPAWYAGLCIPRKQRAPKIQQPRYRLACCGELIQIGGCDHHWFENRAPACIALVYVDNATSHLMQLRFVKSESTFTYFEAIRGYLEKQYHIIRWRKDSTDWLREVIMLPLMHTLSMLIRCRAMIERFLRHDNFTHYEG